MTSQTVQAAVLSLDASVAEGIRSRSLGRPVPRTKALTTTAPNRNARTETVMGSGYPETPISHN